MKIKIDQKYHKKLIKAVKDLKGLYNFPKKEIQLLSKHRAESTPLLLDIVKQTVNFYKRADSDHFDYIAAFYLLSQFREQQAFPYVMKIAALPENYVEQLLGDCQGQDLAKWIVSTFNGDVQAIKKLIENETASLNSRTAALCALVGLVCLNKISRDNIVDYYRELLTSPLVNDEEFSGFLVEYACDLDAKAFFEEIKNLYDQDLVEPFMSWDEVVRAANQENVSCDPSEFLINDVLKNMAWMEMDPKDKEFFELAVKGLCCSNKNDTVLI